MKCVNVTDTVEPGVALPDDGEGIYFVVQPEVAFKRAGTLYDVEFTGSVSLNVIAVGAEADPCSP